MIIGHWQTVSIFSSCHAPLSSTTSLHFHPRPSRPSSPTNCLMKDPTCSSTWAIVHGPSLGNSTVKNMARIDVLCKKNNGPMVGNISNILSYYIILSYVYVFFFAWSKIITMIFCCTSNQQTPGKSRGPTYHLARCWSEGFLLGQFHDQWMFSWEHPL